MLSLQVKLNLKRRVNKVIKTEDRQSRNLNDEDLTAE